MLSISNEYELSLSENSNQLIKGAIGFADNTTRDLTGDDIVSCSFDQQVSSEGSFDVGTAIIGQMNITLNNHDGRFDACDFTDSKFRVWVGKELSTGTEWIQRGLYTANQPDAYNGTIAISALDTISRFEVPFSEFVKATGLPLNDSVQIRHVIGLMCHYRGVQWDDDGNKSLNRPFVFAYVDQSATCRQVLAYCCQVCCVNASATFNGHLRTAWYDTSVFESEDDCDGGVFDSDSPYSTGTAKDGGNFLDYSSGDSVDGGTFITNRSVHQLYAFSNVTVNTDDVVITGVRVSERNVTENNETVNGETVLAGEEGYVLSISNNPLILPGFGRDVAETIANKVIGMRFRPFSGKHICVPSIEAGDCAYVIDRKQNMHRSYVTRVKYTVNGGMTVSCGAKSASRNSADNAGASTSAYVKARNDMQRELSARDLAIKSLGESLANAKGMYHTEVKQEDGSIVYYLHDKPTTDQSKIIYKIAADGIGISTDSGKTYATGLTADGTALLNRIYAIGLDASYIKTGEFDASNVRIKNLMQIGSDETSLKMSNNNIVFNAFGEESLEISPTTNYPKTIVLKNDDGTPLLKVTGPGSSTYTSDFYPQNPHIGKCHIEPLGDGTGYLAWYSVTLSIYDPKNGGDRVFSKTDTIKMLRTDPTYSAGDHVFRIPLYISNTVQISIWFSGFGSVDDTYDSAISVTLSPTGNYLMQLNNATYSTWDSVVGAAIVDKRNDVTFLTNKNYMSLLNYGHTYTGSVNIPYVRGNAMRNYLMQFDHGLLSDFRILTPTDPGFVMP